MKLFKSYYRWYVLVLAMLTYGVIAGAERMALPVLFKEISTDLNLSVVSIGTIWGMDPLAGIFIGLPGGLLADRFGLTRTLTIVCIMSGIFCALRGFSVNFMTMALSMFLFGLMAAMTPSTTPKITAVWFSGKYLGLTNALLNIAWSTGSMVSTMLSATVLSPLLGGWRHVMFFLGAPAVIVGLLWLITGRDPDKREPVRASITTVPLRESLSRVIRIKELWILGLVQLFLWSTYTGSNGYLALYLRNIGWTPAGADAAITILTGASLAGTIPMILLSNRLQAPKAMIVFSIVILIASNAVLPFVRNEMVYPLLAISGFLRSAGPALTNMLIFETPGVGTSYAGGAIGLTTTVGMIGSFAGPPLGNSLAVYGAGMPFLFWALTAAVSLPLFLLVKENRAPEKALEKSG
jgi:sugar phosphate permease